jgi:4-carboxymuconolactone decarboxylase
MNNLSPRERELVALGAAMGSNCISCIEYHIPEARKAGLTDSQISEAIGLADKVRQVPARKVLNAALKMLPETSADGETNKEACTAAAPTARASDPCCSYTYRLK